MARKLRTTTADDIHCLKKALEMLKAARTYARNANARRSHAYIGRAIKSAQGALNHAQRAARTPR